MSFSSLGRIIWVIMLCPGVPRKEMSREIVGFCTKLKGGWTLISGRLPRGDIVGGAGVLTVW